jgi:hypothetical protein
MIKFAEATGTVGFLLLTSLVLSPVTSDNLLGPQDLVPCLNNGCAMRGKTLSNSATEIVPDCKTGSPGAL